MAFRFELLFEFFVVWSILLSIGTGETNLDPCMRPCGAQSMSCEYDWEIEWYQVLSKACMNCPFNRTHCSRKDCVSANGVDRAILVVNRMLPGPAIHACLDDEIQIRVHNALGMFEGTSIHWHGLHQRRTPFMDGVSMVTQCPINSHSYFDYRFKADVSGTHLWHAHSGLQRADGVYGSLIIRESDSMNPYFGHYDHDLAEHVIVLSDWISETTISKFSGYYFYDGDNYPNSILINGKGVGKRFQDSVGGREYETPRAEFNVDFGKIYRFRLINAGFLNCPMEFSIDSHKLILIASDGRYLDAKELDSIMLYAGERFDFLLNATQTPQPYWIRVRGVLNCRFNEVFETAILSYKNGADVPLEPLFYFNMSREGLQLDPWNVEITDDNRDQYVNIDELRSIDNGEITKLLERIKNSKHVKKFFIGMDYHLNPEFADEQAELEQFNRTLAKVPQLNNISFEMPSAPVLYNWDRVPKNKICNRLDFTDACQNMTDFCSCIHTYEFKIGDVIEMIFVDEGFNSQSVHPIHLHGHSFAILNVAMSDRPLKVADVELLDAQGKVQRNFENPPVKDTVFVPMGGYVVFRFVADNPGTWMLHCHLDFHSETGMALLIRTGAPKDVPKPPPQWPRCGDFPFSNERLQLSVLLIFIISTSLFIFFCVYILFFIIL